MVTLLAAQHPDFTQKLLLPRGNHFEHLDATSLNAEQQADWDQIVTDLHQQSVLPLKRSTGIAVFPPFDSAMNQDLLQPGLYSSSFNTFGYTYDGLSEYMNIYSGYSETQAYLVAKMLTTYNADSTERTTISESIDSFGSVTYYRLDRTIYTEINGNEDLQTQLRQRGPSASMLGPVDTTYQHWIRSSSGDTLISTISMGSDLQAPELIFISKEVQNSNAKRIQFETESYELDSNTGEMVVLARSEEAYEYDTQQRLLKVAIQTGYRSSSSASDTVIYTQFTNLDFLYPSVDSITILRDSRDTSWGFQSTTLTVEIYDEDGDLMIEERREGLATLAEPISSRRIYNFTEIDGIKYLDSTIHYSRDTNDSLQVERKWFHLLDRNSSSVHQAVPISPCTVFNAVGEDIRITVPNRVNATLFTMDGRLQWSGTIEAGEQTLPQSNQLPPGMYVIHAQSPSGDCSAKLVR